MKDYLSFHFYDKVRNLPKIYSKLRYPLAYDHYVRYRFFSKKAEGNVLDVACGSGYGTFMISENEGVKKVMGIDINVEGHSYAKSLGISKLTFDKFDLLKDNSTSIKESFKPNTIYCFEIIEHFDAKGVEIFLSKIKAFASKNTLIMFSTPNTTVFSPHGHKWLPYHPIEYSEYTFKNLLVKNGFNIEKMYYQRPVDTGFLILVAKPLFMLMYILGLKKYDNKVFKLFYAFYVRLELLFSRDSISLKKSSAKYLIAECKIV